jgi:hypothetical protein
MGDVPVPHFHLTGRAASTQIRFEQLVNPSILIEPARGLSKSMSLDGIDRAFPTGLFELDEALNETHRVLEEDVVVEHSVRNE